MAALIYEVVWTRKLSTIMGSSTYALSTMLSAFMAGLSVGGWLGARLSPRLKNMAVAFALCELGIGLMGLLTIPLITALTPLYLSSFFAFHESFSLFSLVQFIIIFTLMGIPTTLMGLTFPLVIKLFTSRSEDAGKQSGRLYSINTFGAIVGSVSAGFLLIPIVGTNGASFCAASLNIFTAALILVMSREFKKVIVASAAVLTITTAVAVLEKPWIPFFSYYSANRFGSYDFAQRIFDYIKRSDENMVLFHYEGVEGDVYLVDEKIGNRADRVLINNGKLEAGNELGFALLAYLPFYAHPATEEPLTALNIGLGSGHTLANLARFPFAHIDSVELSKGVIEANKRFLSPGLFSDPKIRHIQADGRNFLFLNPRKYDIIVASPSWAVEEASAGLLTEEFFSLASSRLNKSGVFAVWIDYFLMEDNDLETILRTIAYDFKYTTAWYADGNSSIILTGSNSINISPIKIMQAVNELRPELEDQYKVAYTNEIIRRLHNGPINTDDKPIIEFQNARHIITGLRHKHKG